MAFQTGTKVDPRLMAVDYSPIIRANEMKAQAISNFGGQVGSVIGGAIAQHKKKKQDKVLKEQASNMVLSFVKKNPEVGAMIGIDDLESSNVAVESLGGAEATLRVLSQFQQNQAETDSLKQNNEIVRKAVASNTNTDGSVGWSNVVSSYIDLGGTDPESVSKIAKEQQAINDPREQSPFVTVNTGGGEKMSPYEKDVYGSQIAPIVKGLPGAREAIDMANLGLNLLNKGVPTGTGQDAALMAKKMANAFGADFDVSNQELFKSKIEPMLMDFIANTKGAISDKEMDVFASWSAGLSKTPEGNRKILNAMKKAANNVIEVNGLLSKMPKASPMQQQEAVNKYLDDNPLVNYSNERNTLVSDDGFRFELIPK
jgi:hypothetical protein